MQRRASFAKQAFLGYNLQMATQQQRPSSRNTRALWILILVALLYGSLLYFRHGVTARHLPDGFIGVALGLFICSRPAANAVDLLYAERYGLRQITSTWDGIGWLALNLVVFFVGFAVIMSGTRQLAAAAI
jgi:type VI protein secretion system component VasF